MAPFKMPMIMWNITTFPIECLCFDLKLEVLEELDAKDVIELVKVNKGFQSMISSRPSIIFGHHVDMIEFGFDPYRIDPQGIEVINLKKLNWESLEVSLDVNRHFPFIKNVRSCNEFWMDEVPIDFRYFRYDVPIDKNHAAFLKQLKVVDSLYLGDCSPVRLELLSHLSMKIKGYAHLPSFLQKAPSIKDLVGHFIETQLNECKMAEFFCRDDDEFHFYYNAFMKTHIKYVVISCNHDRNLIVAAILRIVSHGIPSKNPGAVVTVCDDFMKDMKATIVVLLKGYPIMKQIYGKNRQPLIALANDRGRGSRYDDVTTMKTFMMKTLCFRRNINATRDCIYMLYLKEFFAFYIKPDEMIDH